KGGPGALGAPLVRAVVDGFAGQRIVAVAIGLEAQGADHLRMAVVAALADVDVTADELQREEGLDAYERLNRLGQVLQRHDFGQAAEGHGDGDQADHEADVLLDLLVAVGRRRGLFIRHVRLPGSKRGRRRGLAAAPAAAPGPWPPGRSSMY